jgi:hypothetical protein
MATSSTFKAIFLGVEVDIDPIEIPGAGGGGTTIAENANFLVGQTYGSAASPLAGQIVTFSNVTDLDGNNRYNQNNNFTPAHEAQGGELYRVDGVTVAHDSRVHFDATLTYTDGTTATVGSAEIWQDVNGNLYLIPENSLNADQLALTAKPIQSITLNSLFNDAGGAGIFREETPEFICFVRGTRITTKVGERQIEELKEGDLVFTLDRGYQPIQWIGHRSFSRAALEANPKLKPIRIQAGALGHDRPEQDLLVSRQHRVLLRNKIAMNMFDTAEVLVSANKLLVLPGIDIEEDCEEVEYYHILFKQHEIVFSNGSPTESLFTGPEALKAVSPEAGEEIAALFPEILEPSFVPVPARLIPEKGRHMKILAKRLAKNSDHAPFGQ